MKRQSGYEHGQHNAKYAHNPPSPHTDPPSALILSLKLFAEPSSTKYTQQLPRAPIPLLTPHLSAAAGANHQSYCDVIASPAQGEALRAPTIERRPLLSPSSHKTAESLLSPPRRNWGKWCLMPCSLTSLNHLPLFH